MLEDLQYLQPQYAFLFFYLIVILGIALFGHWKKQRDLARFTSSEGKHRFFVRSRQRRRWVELICYCLVLIFATLAVMEPVGNFRYEGGGGKGFFQTKAHETVFLIDTSASMEADDERSKSTRFDFAKEVADHVVQDLPGETFSLYSMNTTIEEVVPPTMDQLFFRIMLRNLHTGWEGGRGTDFLTALNRVHQVIGSRPKELMKTVVIFTDGGDTLYESSSGSLRKSRLETILSAIPNVEETNIHLSSVGLGTEEGVQLEGITYLGKPIRSALQPELLQAISNQGQGRTFFAQGKSSIEVAEEISNWLERASSNAKWISKKQEMQTAKLLYSPYFFYPLSAAIFFLLCAMVIRWSLLPRWIDQALLGCALLMLWNPLSAEDLLQERNFQAKSAFEAHQYPRAANQFLALTDQVDERWQKTILQYNLATSYLFQEAWNQSLEIYLEGLRQDLLPASIYSSLKLNSALAKMGKAISFFQMDSLSISEKTQLAQEQIDDAEVLMNEAFRSYCELRPSDTITAACPSAPRYLQSMRLLDHLKGELDRFKSKRFLFSRPLDQQISLIIQSMQSLIDQTENWVSDEPPPIFYQLQLLTPLFDELDQQWISPIVKEAEAEFLIARSEAEKGSYDFKTTSKSLFKSIHLLQKAVDTLPTPPKEHEQYYRLEELFAKNLERPTIDSRDLDILYVTLKKVDEEKTLQKITELVGLAERSLSQNDPKTAKILVMIGRILLSQTLLQRKVEKPKQLLNQFLELQQDVWELTSMTEEAAEEEGSASVLKEPLENLQQEVGKQAKQFVSSVLVDQEKSFENSDHPPKAWRQVIPFYYEGFMSEQKAQKEFDSLNFSSLLAHQREAILNWRQALEGFDQSVVSASLESMQMEEMWQEQVQRLLDQLKEEQRLDEEKLDGEIRSERPW